MILMKFYEYMTYLDLQKLFFTGSDKKVKNNFILTFFSRLWPIIILKNFFYTLLSETIVLSKKKKNYLVQFWKKLLHFVGHISNIINYW